jgi:hypothetical protein
MAGKHNFAALRQHATKEYKFKQGSSLEQLDPGEVGIGNFDKIKSGICAALAANWLKEKLSSAKHPAFSGPSAGADVHAGRNLDTVRSAVPKFLAYKENPFPSEVLAQYGLAPSPQAAALNPLLNEQVPTTTRSYSDRTHTWTERRTTMAVPKVAESLANACSAGFLKQGRGVYIGFSVVGKTADKRGGGHAVAAYRSRGNTLYFFDPNCGVYDVTDPDKFFAAYVACYGALGYDLAIDAGRNDGFTYVDR